jgi:NAD(P)H-hydrate repair Nnr-like enzyme with NAD(P)H-hydrate dehydratase domain
MNSILHYTHSFKWSDVAFAVGNIIPPLLNNNFKGQMGRIGVVGGSEYYSGAPYYSAQTSLNFGADLAFVFCSKSSSVSIKSYSPELMVIPFYNDDETLHGEQASLLISIDFCFNRIFSFLMLSPKVCTGWTL